MKHTPDSVHLRRFESSDAPTILGWCTDKRSFRLWSADRYKDFPASTDEMLAMYGAGNVFPFTLVDGGDVVGHLILRYPTENKDIVRLGFVIVDKARRGMGYGRKMLELAIDYARINLGAKRITLGVFCENASAIECYKAVGFGIVANDSYVIDGEDWQGFEMELI